jgi:hypothetical protein
VQCDIHASANELDYMGTHCAIVMRDALTRLQSDNHELTISVVFNHSIFMIKERHFVKHSE